MKKPRCRKANATGRNDTEQFVPIPDSGWTRMLADIQAAIGGVDAVMDEEGP